MNEEKSSVLFDRALRSIPGGVNSPVRAWNAVGGHPRFVSRAEGARIWDADGNVYTDFVASWGPMLFGHRAPEIVAAIENALAYGTSFGAPHENEVTLAETVAEMVPGIEKLRLVNSGTEATMSALRLARAATGRAAVVKFAGCYHGHVDGLLVRAGSGATTLGVPDSPGIPGEIAALTRIAEFNDLKSVEAVCDDDVAAIIVEPVAGNMGVVRPRTGFLEGLRTIADRTGALLIFDEVITGFRLAAGGYQEICGVRPDLTCLGKILGGGLPLAAYGGRAELMDEIAPAGGVYQAGTLSGNPLAVGAGLAALERIRRDPPYPRLEELGRRLERGLAEALGARRAYVSRIGSMLTVFFGVGEAVENYTQARSADTGTFARFFRAMLDRGVWLPPSQFETWFVSTAHTEADIDRTIEAATAALSASG